MAVVGYDGSSMRVMSMLVIVGCSSASSTTPTARPSFALTPAAFVMPSELERDAAALVNRYRTLAGAPPIEIDRALGAGCAEHATYLWRNRGSEALRDLRVHSQDPSLPGASARGAACGKAGVIDQVARDAGDAIEAWMGTLYHRAPLLAPYVNEIGIGAAGPAHARAVVMAFGLAAAPAARWPIAFPVDGQTGVRVDFVAEVPNPIPGDRRGGGYPFTLQFPPRDPLTGVRAKLVDDSGKSIAFYLSSPERPARTDHPQRGLVGVIPARPLRAGTRYTVTIDATWNGKRGRWSSTFTTLPRRDVDATDRAALTAAIDTPARLRGIVQHVSATKTYGVLELAPDVEVRVPRALVSRSLVGARVEADGTPMQVGKATIRVVVDDASALRLSRE